MQDQSYDIDLFFISSKSVTLFKDIALFKARHQSRWIRTLASNHPVCSSLFCPNHDQPPPFLIISKSYRARHPYGDYCGKVDREGALEWNHLHCLEEAEKVADEV